MRRCLWILSIFLLNACNGGGDNPPSADATVDATAFDAAPTDADPEHDAQVMRPDRRMPDAEVPDAMPDAGVPCEPGEEVACGPAQGACEPGVQRCGEAGFLGPCEGAVGPVEETCNAIDDDCDGFADEDAILGDPSCDTGQVGACARGRRLCQAGEEICQALQSPRAELCNGEDDDCDGETDEGPSAEEPLVRSCYDGPAGTRGIGICEAGAQRCVEGAWGPCSGEVGPAEEICDGIDNDCDGRIDDGNPGGGDDCDTGEQGLCARGLTVCDGGEVSCVRRVAQAPEICDELDNDCDGATDEGVPGSGEPCFTGQQGVCGQGQLACRSGALICRALREPALERCDGADDDCDGTVDELVPGAGDACDTGRLGACAMGVQVCEGQGLRCEGAVEPGVEVCNGVDDDCDGATDEGDPGGGVGCSTGAPGVCSAGDTVCAEGEIRCVAVQAAGEEVCDTLDNDCDGSTDENNPGGGLACDTRRPGLCAPGVTRCTPEGEVVCDGAEEPVEETCDGQDEDCDGAIDEGNPGGGDECDTGQQGLCAPGTLLCRSGRVICQRAVDPIQERCDGVDNDCDGAIDEDFPLLGESCTVGQGQCAREGVYRCTPQGRVELCDAVAAEPQPDVCDFLDNDCDGRFDENNPGGGVPCDTEVPGICFEGLTDCRLGRLECVQQVEPLPEACTGIDDDCDGNIDELPVRSRVDQQITEQVRTPASPTVAWLGDRFAVAWLDSRNGAADLFFNGVNPDGSLVRPDGDGQISRRNTRPNGPELIAMGNQYLLVWSGDIGNNFEIFVGQIDADLRLRFLDQQVSATDVTSDSPAAAWTGEEVGIIWREVLGNTRQLLFRRFNAQLEPQGPPVLIRDVARNLTEPAIVWMGDRYAVAWSEDNELNQSEIQLMMLSPEGQPIVPPANRPVTSGQGRSLAPSLAWSGSRLLVAWHDFQLGTAEIFYRVYDGVIDAQGPQIAYSNALRDALPPERAAEVPDLAGVNMLRVNALWTGSEFALSWDAQDQQGFTRIYFTRLAEDGAVLGEPIAFTGGGGSHDRVSMAWTGLRFGLAWISDVQGAAQVLFGTGPLGCPPAVPAAEDPPADPP